MYGDSKSTIANPNLEKLREFYRKILGKRKQLIWFNIIVGILALIILVFFVRSYYTSTVTILPDIGAKQSLMQLSDLASLVGINVSEGGETNIYRKIVSAETVLKPVVYYKYKTEEFSQPVNLIKYFDIDDYEDKPEELRKRKRFLDVKKILTDNLKTELDKKTNVLKISVTMPESKLSSDVANNIVNSLDQYLRNKTKFRAKEQRIYLEKRIKQLKDSLFRAEENFKAFREKNRKIDKSPALLLEQKRLAREIEILQTVYAELNKHLELAKIEEIKDAPILNIMEYAQEPVRKAGPPKLLIFLFIISVSIILSLLYAIYFDRYYNLYRTLVNQLKQDNPPNK